MLACFYDHIDIARMLAGEFNANIDIQTRVGAISRSCLCDDVRACRVGVSSLSLILSHYWFHYIRIAPLHLVVMDAICYVNVLMVVVVVVVVV